MTDNTQTSLHSKSSHDRTHALPFKIKETSTRPLLSAVKHSANSIQNTNISDNLSNFDDAFTLRSTPISYHSTASRPKRGQCQLSARCYPFVREQMPLRYKIDAEMNDSEYYMSCITDDTNDSALQHGNMEASKVLSKQQDFIRRLPVHLSKYILGYLDSHSLINCICVSKHWRMLAEEVKNELRIQHLTKDDIMLIQVKFVNISAFMSHIHPFLNYKI